MFPPVTAMRQRLDLHLTRYRLSAGHWMYQTGLRALNPQSLPVNTDTSHPIAVSLVIRQQLSLDEHFKAKLLIFWKSNYELTIMHTPLGVSSPLNGLNAEC